MRRMDHPHYTRWRTIIARCHYDWNKDYPNYGGRGIVMHWDWLFDLYAFADYMDNVVGPKPTPQHQLDRIDNDKGYEPGGVPPVSPDSRLV